MHTHTSKISTVHQGAITMHGLLTPAPARHPCASWNWNRQESASHSVPRVGHSLTNRLAPFSTSPPPPAPAGMSLSQGWSPQRKRNRWTRGGRTRCPASVSIGGSKHFGSSSGPYSSTSSSSLTNLPVPGLIAAKKKKPMKTRSPNSVSCARCKLPRVRLQGPHTQCMSKITNYAWA